MMRTVTISNTTNPDSSSIIQKNPIDISVNNTDINSAGYQNKLIFNGVTNATVMYQVANSSVTTYSGSYYVPLYKEKINYNSWLSTIDKRFNSL